MLKIRVLGGFSVSVDDEEVSVDAWRSRRAADIVKLLALEPSHSLHREQVMDALWPDLAPDAAAANLRKALHYARRAMGSDDAIQVREGMVTLPSDTDIDLGRFEKEDDLALYTGDVLPADRYEPWAEDARTRARDRYVAALKRGEDWERVLEVELADESAHRALMRRYVDAGDRRSAIRQFEQLREILREHIGLGPDGDTVAVYEEALALGGAREPTDPSERVASLVSNALVTFGRRELEEAERLTREARQLAIDADLPHELGEASTLLSLIAYAKGTWHADFREDFAASVAQDPHMAQATYDGHLCFLEYFLYGPHGHEGADEFGHDLLDIARAAGSETGQALATLVVGESALLSGDLATAAETLEEAVHLAGAADAPSIKSIALERRAETDVALGDAASARDRVAEAKPIAAGSSIPTHLTVRLLGIQVLAADGAVDGLSAVTEAERWLADAWRVCDPCSMTLRVEAARTSARAGDIARAKRHLAEAERITSLWQGGTPWNAATWEVRAEIRRAEGQLEQARALLLEAADGFAEVHRPRDEARCRVAADALEKSGVV